MFLAMKMCGYAKLNRFKKKCLFVSKWIWHEITYKS